MKRMFFIISLLLCLPLAAQQTYRARVVDAETGEALPYVSVCASSKTETVTNMEGEFAIVARTKDELRLSLVGYESTQVKAGKMETTIKMWPMQCVESEDSMKVVAHTLYDLFRYFYSSTNSWKECSKAALFFYRYCISNEKGIYMGEASMRACNSCNLRNFELMEKSFYNDVEEETLGDWPLYLQRLYINSTLQLGPFPYDVVGFWSLHLFPLYYDNYRLHCRARCYELKSSKGEKIYKICIQPRELNQPKTKADSSMIVKVGSYRFNASSLVPSKPKSQLTKEERMRLLESSMERLTDEDMLEEYPNTAPAPYEYKKHAILNGTLYLDKNKLPLVFEGEVLRYGIEMPACDWTPAKIHVRIEYQNKGGHAYVKAAYGTLEYADIKSRAMMISLPSASIPMNDFSSIVLRNTEEEQAVQKYLKSKE